MAVQGLVLSTPKVTTPPSHEWAYVQMQKCHMTKQLSWLT